MYEAIDNSLLSIAFRLMISYSLYCLQCLFIRLISTSTEYTEISREILEPKAYCERSFACDAAEFRERSGRLARRLLHAEARVPRARGGVRAHAHWHCSPTAHTCSAREFTERRRSRFRDELRVLTRVQLAERRARVLWF